MRCSMIFRGPDKTLEAVIGIPAVAEQDALDDVLPYSWGPEQPAEPFLSGL